MVMVLTMKMGIILLTMTADLEAKVICGYDSKKGLRGEDENDVLEAPTKVLLFGVPCLNSR